MNSTSLYHEVCVSAGILSVSELSGNLVNSAVAKMRDILQQKQLWAVKKGATKQSRINQTT